MGLVQAAHNSASNTQSTSITFASNITAGNTVIVCLSGLSAIDAANGQSVTGSSDTFTQVVANDTTGQDAVAIFSVQSSAGGYKTVSTSNSMSNAFTIAMWAYEVSGLASVDNTSNSSIATAGTVFDSGSASITSGDFCVGIGCTQGAVTVSGPGAPWNNEASQSPSFGPSQTPAISGYQTATTTSTDYSGTFSGSGVSSCACVAAFKLAALTVSISDATVAIAVNAVTPLIGVGQAVGPARITSITVYPLLRPGLVVSMAMSSGTDTSGNAFPGGFGGLVTAFEPGALPTITEIWHTINPPAGWTGTLRYKILPEANFALIDINLTAATGTAGTIALGVLPASYVPLGNLFRPIVVGSAGTNLAADLKIASSGSLVAENYTTTSTISTIAASIIYPLDL